MPRPTAFCRQATAKHDLRTYFIARPTNSYTTMHYNVANGTRIPLDHRTNSGTKDVHTGPPPATMEQADGPPHRVDQVHWDTVRHRDCEEETRGRRHMPIEPVELHPAAAPGVPGNRAAMHLRGQNRRLEPRLGSPEGPPARHRLADRCLIPQTQVKTPPRLISAAGHPRHHAELLTPARDLPAGDWAGEQGFSDDLSCQLGLRKGKAMSDL